MKTSIQKGFSLVEMVIYIAILSLVTVVVINILMSFNGTYREVRMHRAIDNGALTALERMTRDIRNATSITINQSTFNTSPGVLVLSTVDALVSTTTRFYVDNGVLKVDVNGVYSGPLTFARTSVSHMSFHRLVSTSSEAIKIDMTLVYTYGLITKTKNYYTTVILKGL